MMVWWLVCALAQDPQDPAGGAPDPEAAAEEPLIQAEGPVEEYIVVGEHVVSQARAEVVRQLEKLGWKARRVRDGVTYLRPPEAWMGKARLMPYGEIDFAQPAITVPGPQDGGDRYEDFDATARESGSGTVGLQIGSPAPRKVDAVQAEVRAAVDEELKAWRQAIQSRALGQQLEALPERLEQLWVGGVGFDRSTLTTWEERRAALLDYWATRTDTVEGRAVTRAVEAFFREEVQGSEHPFEQAEIEAAQGRREDGRSLEL